MKLFYARGACSLAARIILNEIGVAIDYDAVDLKTKQTASGQDFLTINAKGYVPTLCLENGEILTENAVILQYLADHYQASNLLPALGDWQRYRVLEWVHFVATELHKGCSPLFHSGIPDDLKQQIFIPKLMKALTYVDQNLQERSYLMGTHFTLPDAYLFVILRWAAACDLPLQSLQHVLRYQMQLRTRKSIADALKQEGLAP
ncbi:MAG: glutathione transferase GstA [Legionellales bacterium]|nr:glutathione transferase GstA [Legionellales bacterium]